MTATLVYRPAATVESMAVAAREMLAKHGHRVIADWDVDDPAGELAVWVIPDGCTTGQGEYFRPGQQLVVAGDGSYQILPVACEVAA